MVPRSFGRATVIVVSQKPLRLPARVRALRGALVAGAAEKHVDLGLDRGLNDQPGAEAAAVLDDLADLPRTVEQGVDLATGPIGG